MSGKSHSHVGPLFTLMVLIWKIGRELDDDDLNLRPSGANRRKWSIFGWEGRGEGCGYSRLQGGSPRMC
jgi:hypothetical protein